MASRQYEIAFSIGGKLQASLPKSVTSAAGQLDRLGKQIAQLEKAQGTSNRFRALKNEISETQLKLRQAEAEMKHLGATVGPMTAEMARRFETVSGRVAKLRSEFVAQGQQLRSAKAAMDAAGLSTRTLAADQAKLAAQMAKATAQASRVRAVQGMRAENKTQRDQVRTRFDESKGQVLTAAAGVAAWVLPVKITADFEDSMIRAGALAKATDADLVRLTNTARQLGRDTRFSATAAATGMQYLAQSGFKTNEIIAAMPGMLQIAAAGAVELGEAADITSNILRGFGMQAGESQRLGDVLANTFTNSSTTLSTLGETMKYVAPVAKATGVSLEMTAAAAGLIGTAGIKGEMAGTALRAMLSRLAAPARQGRDALAMLGVKTKDARGNLLPLGDVLAKMSAKLQKFGSGTRQAAITHIFGMEAATAATVLLGEAGSGNLQRFTQMVKRSGTAAEIAAKQNASLKGNWDNLYGSIEDVGIQIGYTLIPTLKGLVDKMVPVINNVTTWLQQNPQLTQTIVLGGVALTSLTLALTVAGVAFNGVHLGMLAAKAAMLALNAVTLKSAGVWLAVNAPLVLTIAAIGGLIAIGWQLKQNWTPISQWWNEMWDGMLDKVAGVWNAIPKPIRWLWSKMSGGAISTDDMVRGPVASTFGPKAQLAGFIAQAQAARDAKLADFQRSASGQAETPSWLTPKNPIEVPSWLTKSPGAGRLSAADQIGNGANSKRGGNAITYSPQINVAPGSAEGARGDVEKGLAAAQREFEKMMRKFMDQEGRLAHD